MKDFIFTITVDIIGEGEGEFVTENNYKEILQNLEDLIISSENDNDLLDIQMDKLADDFREDGAAMPWAEWNEEANKITKQRRENDEFIKKCENTIEIIEKIAEIREWE